MKQSMSYSLHGDNLEAFLSPALYLCGTHYFDVYVFKK